MLKLIRSYLFSTLYLAPIIGIDIFDEEIQLQNKDEKNLLALNLEKFSELFEDVLMINF